MPGDADLFSSPLLGVLLTPGEGVCKEPTGAVARRAAGVIGPASLPGLNGVAGRPRTGVLVLRFDGEPARFDGEPARFGDAVRLDGELLRFDDPEPRREVSGVSSAFAVP